MSQFNKLSKVVAALAVCVGVVSCGGGGGEAVHPLAAVVGAR